MPGPCHCSSIQVLLLLWQNEIFWILIFKYGSHSDSFYLFPAFLNTVQILTSWIKNHRWCLLDIRTLDRWMVGADESTELWLTGKHYICTLKFLCRRYTDQSVSYQWTMTDREENQNTRTDQNLVTEKSQQKPCSSGYERRPMFQRSWVQIPAPYTGWAFFNTPLWCKICNVCLKRHK